MAFEGPSAVDYENVRTLNRAFLALMKRDPAARRCLAALRARHANRLSTLTDPQADRLSRAPFLLFSLRERDDRFWAPVFEDQLFEDQRCRDLFAVPPSSSDDLGRLIAAGLGFIWQLAQHNPYAARLICGASLHWCEQLTERTFLHVLSLASIREDILTVRSAQDVELWEKLLGSGVSRQQAVRRAAHVSALQSVLTPTAPPGIRWATAACATRPPMLRVAEDDS